MKKKYMLPAMKNNIEVDSRDCWTSVDDAYDFLISNLKLYYEPNQSVFEGGSNAVPHMFEQMLIFHKALLDEKNPDHCRAVAEWRAVLSIMALQKICNINLDLILIDLSVQDKNPFLRAASKFCPEDTPVFFNTTWDFLYVIKIKQVPIAILSPVTLVCPSKQFVKKLKKLLDHNKIAVVRDPKGDYLKFNFKGNNKEIPELLKWLKTLEKNLIYSDLPNTNCYNKFETVRHELDQFIKEYDKDDSMDELSPLLQGIYSSMNDNIRKEYYFLNNCCGIVVKNPKLSFLIDRYKEDIFEEKILVMVYDDTPDTLERRENVRRLKKLYQNILEIKPGKPIIEVYSNGGVRMAACVFLPFKNHFVEELIQHNITPNEFFEQFSATYDPGEMALEITLQIKEFPYSFTKKYYEGSWQFLYGKDLEATYIWPSYQVDNAGWKTYYIYTEEKNSTEIEVTVPEAVRQEKYIDSSSGGSAIEFQLCKSNTFPAYLCYTCQGVSGFLPIWTKHVGTKDVGSTADIIIDMGHATTTVAVIKNDDNHTDKSTKKNEIGFQIPRSSRIAGNVNKFRTASVNFVIPNEEYVESVRDCIKNMLNSFRKYEKRPIIQKERKPFEDGQILFDGCAYLNESKQSIVSYINYEYVTLNEIEREKVHIFVEQLLMYLVYQVIVRECSYIRLYFLHPYNAKDETDATKLGELKGLWENAVCNVRRQTGIGLVGESYATAIRDCEALSWYVYSKVYESKVAENNRFPEDCIYAGVNIGWKNTNVVLLRSNKITKKNPDGIKTGAAKSGGKDGEENPDLSEVISSFTTLEYAGRNISMLVDADDGSLNLKCYPVFLKILLYGDLDSSNKTDTEQMLEEFGELFDKEKMTKDVTHYQGLFDLIAMKIAESNFKMSSDVFHNMYEFRYFLMALTYNLILLFLNIGMLIRKCEHKDTKKITLYVGGNGAVFLKWISNIKSYNKIDNGNASWIFILSLQSNIINCIKHAAGVDDSIEVEIILEDHADKQLVQGCKEMIFRDKIESERLICEHLNNLLNSEQCEEFAGLIDNMCREVFQGFSDLCDDSLVGSGNFANGISAVEMIENKRKIICRRVTQEINKIKDE